MEENLLDCDFKNDQLPGSCKLLLTSTPLNQGHKIFMQDESQIYVTFFI